ncbi:hypothetical protein D6779_01045, partial [Candidatus Parcubacteria bacterium]
RELARTGSSVGREVMGRGFFRDFNVGAYRLAGLEFDLVPGFSRLEADCVEMLGRTVCEARQR